MAEPSARPREGTAPTPSRGLLDTSVVVDHDVIDAALLPDEAASRR